MTSPRPRPKVEFSEFHLRWNEHEHRLRIDLSMPTWIIVPAWLVFVLFWGGVGFAIASPNRTSTHPTSKLAVLVLVPFALSLVGVACALHLPAKLKRPFDILRIESRKSSLRLHSHEREIPISEISSVNIYRHLPRKTGSRWNSECIETLAIEVVLSRKAGSVTEEIPLVSHHAGLRSTDSESHIPRYVQRLAEAIGKPVEITSVRHAPPV